MPLPNAEFKAQARRAGRTISWRMEAVMTGSLVLFIGFAGLLLLSSVLWFGMIALLTAFAIAGYGIRRVSVGRHRDLVCPNCGATGEIIKIQHSFQFHCSRCDQTADTGISSGV